MNFSETQTIFESIKKEDKNVLLEIYRQYFQQVRHYILENSGNVYDAEDIFQDAMVLIYIKIRKSPVSLNHSFGTFLFGVAKFLWLKELERKRKYFGNYSELGEVTEHAEDFLEAYYQMEKQKLFTEHFNSMGEDCKKLLQLYFNETTISRITLLLGYSSEQYTKNRRVICKERLVRSIWNSPRFKELKNEEYREDTEVPRW